jgi:hypothetical protein
VVGDLYRELRVTFLKKKRKKTYPKSRLVIQRGNWPIIRQLMSKGPTNASSLCCFKTQQDLGLFSTHAQSSSSVSFDVLFVSSRGAGTWRHGLSCRGMLSRPCGRFRNMFGVDSFRLRVRSFVKRSDHTIAMRNSINGESPGLQASKRMWMRFFVQRVSEESRPQESV